MKNQIKDILSQYFSIGTSLGLSSLFFDIFNTKEVFGSHTFGKGT